MEHYSSTPTPQLVFDLKKPATNKALSSAGVAGSVIQGPSRVWSGYDVNATTQAWKTSEGTWQVPNVGSVCGPSSEMSIWTGLGGVNSGNFMQSGINFNNNIPGQVSLWTPFYEYFHNYTNNGPYELYGASNTALSIQPGNVVFSSTYYDTTTGQAQFYLEDESTGQVAVLLLPNMGGYWDGSTAEWITETDAVGAQFQSFAIVTAYAQNTQGPWYKIAQAGNAEFWIPTRINPGPLGSTGAAFSEGFDACL